MVEQIMLSLEAVVVDTVKEVDLQDQVVLVAHVLGIMMVVEMVEQVDKIKVTTAAQVAVVLEDILVMVEKVLTALTQTHITAKAVLAAVAVAAAKAANPNTAAVAVEA